MNGILNILILLVGVGVGFAMRMMYIQAKKKSLDLDIKKIELDAREQAQDIIAKADEYAQETRVELKAKEDHLIKKETILDQRQTDIDKEREKLQEQLSVSQELKNSLSNEKERLQTEIERIAHLSREDAREELLHIIEKNYEEDLIVRVRKMEQFNKEQLEEKAKEILVDIMQRLASSVAQEVTTTTVTIPNDEVKGKIIGKEGRNIRSFERAAGVEVVIDDTPGSVVISSFDPIRRQIARVALENLIIDGRIQPAKIEEFIESAKKDIQKIIKEKGEWAVHELGIYNLDPRVIGILGRLWFRTSYGQNVLQHSVEMARLASMLAEEVGGDVMIAKAGALVHDIGKALDHEIQGTHLEIGIRILRKFGTDERIIDAMKSHHGDYPHASIESVIVTTVDALSGARPGARRDTLENYLKRL